MQFGQFRLKKSLGQHFLRDENICRRIIQALQAHLPVQLLEVGPGSGALTKHLLLLQVARFKAVEIDQEKIAFLKKTYPVLSDKLIEQDFLDMEIPFEGPFTVVGNFPYNISSQILFKIIDWKDSVEGVIGMFQKEVAKRIASSEGSKTYGVLSVLVQAFFEVEYLFEVSENSFYPPPKVKSAVIRLVPRRKKLDIRSERDLFILVKAAFNQRRKTLRNATKELFEESVLKTELFSGRAEQLSVLEFAALTHRMK
jgi:16S rRNA (adenine1518-N6/adenine1519-N6)-dimethyltransferase